MHYNDQGADFKYLIVNERDKRFGLSVTTVGFQAIRAGSVYPPRNHPDAYYFTAQKGRVLHEYQLVYITKGRGTFASDTTPSVDISKGQILFLFPGQWHTYAPLQKTGWNEYYIGFEGPIIDNLVKNSFISKESQILDIGINEELASLFARALEVAEADKTAAQQYLSGIVLHIMGAVLAISQNKRYEVDNAAQKNRKCQNHHARKCIQGYRPGRTGHEIGNQLFLVPQSIQRIHRLCARQVFPRAETAQSEAAVD